MADGRTVGPSACTQMERESAGRSGGGRRAGVGGAGKNIISRRRRERRKTDLYGRYDGGWTLAAARSDAGRTAA